jgi:hypothetical protein
MTMHILKGEFPIVYWGQSYMGTQESYIDAPLMYLFGVNAFSIRIFSFVFSILFMYFSYKLACKIYNRDVGIITLLLLAIPIPYLSIASAVIQPDTYIPIITFGTIALLITHDLVFSSQTSKKSIKFAFLGFLLGFAFWMHLLIVVYIPVVAFFLFLKDKLIIFRKNFWIFILSFIVGGFPIIYYNFANDFATFRYTAGGVNFQQALENFKALFSVTLHFLLGLKIMLTADTSYNINLPGFLYLSAGAIFVFLLVYVIATKFKNIWRICILSLKNVDGTSLLIITAIASIYIFCRTARTNWYAVRYILPIMPALPIIIAYGLWQMFRFSKALGICLTCIILVSHVWGNVILAKAINTPDFVGEKIDQQDLTPVINFLKENEIYFGYSNYCVAYPLTYITQEKIIIAPPFDERQTGYKIPYIDQVRKADKVAYIMHKNLGVKADDFENKLKIIGGKYKRKSLGAYTVFYAFEPPYKESKLTQIPSTDWKAGSNFKTENASLAIDNNITTRWGSGAPQQPGMFFSIDLGKPYQISKIAFNLGKFVSDSPRGYKIETSIDNKQWNIVSDNPNNIGGLFWEGSHPRFLLYDEYFTAAFNPVQTRYIKITQTGYDQRFDWSIAEILIFG